MRNNSRSEIKSGISYERFPAVTQIDAQSSSGQINDYAKYDEPKPVLLFMWLLP